MSVASAGFLDGLVEARRCDVMGEVMMADVDGAMCRVAVMGRRLRRTWLKQNDIAGCAVAERWAVIGCVQRAAGTVDGRGRGRLELVRSEEMRSFSHKVLIISCILVYLSNLLLISSSHCSKPGDKMEATLEANVDTTNNEALLSPPLAADTKKRDHPTNSNSRPMKRSKNEIKHPRVKLRHCMCPNPKECRAIMTRWLAIKENERVEYLHVPLEISRGKETANARHVMAFREGVFRYLYGEKIKHETGVASDEIPAKEETLGQESMQQQEETAAATEVVTAAATTTTTTTNDANKLKEATDSPSIQLPKDQRIAFCHFHPKVIEQLLKEKEQSMFKRHRWRIPLSLGEEIGLHQPQDLCPDPDSNDETTYFALPNYSLQSAMADIETAEEAYTQRVNKSKKSQSKLAKLISGNPHQYALELHELRLENARLSAEVRELKSRLKSEHGIRCKIEQKNQSMDKKLTQTKHRLEKVAESKKTIVKRGRPPKIDTDVTKNLFMNIDLNNSLSFLPGWADPTNVGDNDTIGQQMPSLLNEDNYPNMLTTHEEKWEYRYQQLLKYKAAYGNCDVPRYWKTNKSLGKWVCIVFYFVMCRLLYLHIIIGVHISKVDNQRLMNAQGRLTLARENKLNAIGFVWRCYPRPSDDIML